MMESLIGNVRIAAGDPVRVMAIVNASPESFYGKSIAIGRQAIRDAAESAAQEGADMLDIGAMSTAPYRETFIEPQAEAERMVEAIGAAREACGLPITADTQRASVARAALDAGADGINDISGLHGDPEMGTVIARAGCCVILMANESAIDGVSPHDPAATVQSLLEQSMRRAQAAGIAPEKILLDPGIGFFRKQSMPWYDFDLALLRGLESLNVLGRPLVVSPSRKSFLGHLTERPQATERLAASLAAAAWCVLHGAAIVRTHDPGETRDVVKILEAIRGG